MSRWGRSGTDELVKAFIGPKGSGKTFSAVERCVRWLKRGHDVWTNQPYEVVVHRGEGCELAGGAHECTCTPRSHVYRTLEEMILAPQPGSLVFLDEAPAHFSARRWQEFPDALLTRLTTVRKDSLRFMYTAIHEDFVDKVLRENTDEWWLCRRVPWVPLIIRSKWVPAAFRKAKERPSYREVVRLRLDICQAYDSWAKPAVTRKVYDRVRQLDGEEWRTIEEWDALVRPKVDATVDASAADGAAASNGHALLADRGTYVPGAGSAGPIDLLRGLAP